MNETQTLSDYAAGEIRAILARRRSTGKELAETLGVSRSWVSYRLIGTTEITLNDLERIARALDVDIADLLPRRVYRDGRRTGEGGIMWPSSHAPLDPTTAGHPVDPRPAVRRRSAAQPAGGHHGESAPSGHRVDTRRTARQRQGRPTWAIGGVTT